MENEETKMENQIPELAKNLGAGRRKQVKVNADPSDEEKPESHSATIDGITASCNETKASAAGLRGGESEAIESLNKLCGVPHNVEKQKPSKRSRKPIDPGTS
jgi:hypothetical protein